MEASTNEAITSFFSYIGNSFSVMKPISISFGRVRGTLLSVTLIAFRKTWDNLAATIKAY